MKEFEYKDIRNIFLSEYKNQFFKINSLDYSENKVLDDFFRNEDFLECLKKILMFNIEYRYTNKAFELAGQSSDAGSREVWYRNRVLEILKETGYFSTFYVEEQLEIFLKDFTLDRLCAVIDIPKSDDTDIHANFLVNDATILLDLMKNLNEGKSLNSYKFTKAISFKTFEVRDI